MGVADRFVKIEDRDYGALEGRALVLSYLGLLPFFATMMVLWLSPSAFSYTTAGNMTWWGLFYGAIILSFLGGIRWGIAMLSPGVKVSEFISLDRLTMSIVPALIAWLLVVPATLSQMVPSALAIRYGILLIAFLFLLDSDMRASREGAAPDWYGGMRLKITLFLAAMLILIILRLVQLGW